ncbi:hypothetical protein CERSUDRAFT_112820 [Gelatoporia subvermispora B]|uniref:SUZ domain-containing protein n=1 Tax=Ceriporiopsis subvermispora (strain B) TaxID=914234 RepID=M2PRC3_CERS8|nr:hypothetical protein CERSUDRAFT_112820 [Gelatoporia subvermispora B]
MSIESSAEQGSSLPATPPSSDLSSLASASPMATATMSASSATSSSASAPDIPNLRPPCEAPLAVSPSLDTAQASFSRGTLPDSPLDTSGSSDSVFSNTNAEPDPQIVEALRSSKDRIYVLKLGEQMERQIAERTTRIDVTASSSYHRLLVHRCSAYYKLAPETDSVTKTIHLYYRAESRVPTRRIGDLVPVEESAQPTFKIMRRNAPDRLRSRQSSQPSSAAGEDADLSDVEPSETGSAGGRSSTTSSTKRHLTIEEREAAYAEARSRIFMGFEAKEKEKEKDTSANSSTFSLISGSGSTSAGRGSSVGDIDDSASSAATESEWSGPATRDRKEGRRSNRSVRSGGGPYNANGSGSSRNSRAASPSFTYATLYEPPAPGSYEGSYPAPPPQGYMPYMYPYHGTPGQVPGQPYVPPYGYYVPYSYSPPHPSSQSADSSNQPSGDPTYPPQPPVPYVQPYMWAQSPPTQPPSMQPSMSQSPTHLTPNQSPPHASHITGPQAQAAPHYSTWVPPGAYPQYPYPYHQPPVPYPNNDPANHAQQPMSGPPYYMPDMQRPNSMPPGYINGNGPGLDISHGRRGNNMNHTGQNGQNGHNKRGMPRRQNWSFGPGTSHGGYTFNASGLGGASNEAVGPRLSNNMRRISGASSGSGSAGTRTPGDEASSTTSSENSSSSRATFTSTSSKHPLPARPDWAVGLKPQPNLHGPRHHDHSNPNSRTMSPARIGGQAHLPSQHQPQPVLQPTDFPPLSSAPAAPERRMPTPGGAWTNSSLTRSVMTAGPPQGNAASHGTALVRYPNSNGSGAQDRRADDQEPGFDRPPPKANAELFNPKGHKPSGASKADKDKGDTVNTATVPDHCEGVTDVDVELNSLSLADDVARSAGGDQESFTVNPPQIAEDREGATGET